MTGGGPQGFPGLSLDARKFVVPQDRWALGGKFHAKSSLPMDVLARTKSYILVKSG